MPKQQVNPDHDSQQILGKRRRMADILTDLFESVQQAGDDLCGDQREWHLPRLQRVMRDMILWFPADAGEAFRRAKTPYDDPT